MRIRRYVQVHTFDHPVNQALRDSRSGAEPYDGVAELWWDSLEDLAAVLSTPAAQQASQELLADERKFIDHSRSALWVGEEFTFVADG